MKKPFNYKKITWHRPCLFERMRRSFSHSLIVVFLIESLAFSPLATATCNANHDSMKADVLFSTPGIQKLLNVSYQVTRDSLNTQLRDIFAGLTDDNKRPTPNTIDIPPLGGDKCKKENILTEYPNVATSADQCFGFIPSEVWPISIQQQQAGDVRHTKDFKAYMEPVDLHLTHLNMKITLNPNPSISCNGMECTVKAGIDQLTYAMNMGIKSINDSCTMVGVQNGKLTLVHSPSGQRASVTLKFRFTSDVQHPIEVEDSGTSVNVPVDAVKFTGQTMRPGSRTTMCPEGQEMETPGLVDALVIKNQDIADQILAVTKQAIVKISNQNIPDIIKKLGFGDPMHLNSPVPSISSVENETELTNLTNSAIQSQERYRQSLDQIGSPGFHPVAGQLTNSIASFLDKFKYANSGSAFSKLSAMSDELKNVISSIKSHKRGGFLGFMNPDDERINNTLNAELIEATRARLMITNFESQFLLGVRGDSNVPLEVAVDQAIALPNKLEVDLSACIDCQATGAVPPPAATWGNPPAQWDAAVKTNLASVNNALQYLDGKNALDSCIKDIQGDDQGVPQMCQGLGAKAPNTAMHLSNLHISYNAGTRSYMVDAHVQLNNQNNQGAGISRQMNMDLHFSGKFVPSADGRTVAFVPDPNSAQISHADFNPGTGWFGWLKAPIAQFLANNSFLDSSIQSVVAARLAIPEGAAITGMGSAQDGSIIVYTQMPDQSHLQTLAASLIPQ